MNEWTQFQRLERAQIEVDRARRQYQLVEPENRLVVMELERQWEETLHEAQKLEQEHARFRQSQSTTLLGQWNETNAAPPWSEKELKHKIESAFAGG